jgi:anti-anti-sigma regulatory factor
LAGQPAQDLLIDMHQVTFVDAAGMDALVTLAEAQLLRGATFAFTGVPRLCRDMFMLADAHLLVEAANQPLSA